MSTTTLLFMGDETIEETFRCRIYVADDEDYQQRRSFVESLAGDGVLDCPAFDNWIFALQARGWIDEKPAIEPIGDGSGRSYRRWKLNDKGRAEWAAMKERHG